MSVPPSELRRIQMRRGTAGEWSTSDPVLLVGELGVEIDTLMYKIGNGTDVWSVLPYGAEGPTGATGAVEVFEQNTQPTATEIGAVWIDPDDTPPIGVGPPGPTGASVVWTRMTQAEFDAIPPPGPDPDELIIIVG
jgi:hypothetical protein